jgi:pyruvate formate lyase activating enzyme
MQGIIFDIKHYALHDGPGIRTTVFLKGCPLGCWWCHNPESRSGKIFSYQKKEKLNDKVVKIQQTIGRKYTINEVMKEVEKDIVLYEESGGGVTISGGEPFFQFDFLMALLRNFKKNEIHTCVDTTGYIDSEKIIEAAEFTDLFLFDLKHFDDKMHIKYTGVSNKMILDNLLLLDKSGKSIEIRYPLIPGINDDEADLLRMLAFLKKLKNNHLVSILPYHKIGSQKYKRFGIEYKMDGVEEPATEHIDRIKKYFEVAGFEVKVGG